MSTMITMDDLNQWLDAKPNRDAFERRVRELQLEIERMRPVVEAAVSFVNTGRVLPIHAAVMTYESSTK